MGYFEKFDVSGRGVIDKKKYMEAAFLLLDTTPEFAKYMGITEDDLQTGVGQYCIGELVWLLNGLTFGEKQVAGKTQKLSSKSEVVVKKIVCPKPRTLVRGYVKVHDDVLKTDMWGTINLWSRTD